MIDKSIEKKNAQVSFKDFSQLLWAFHFRVKIKLKALNRSRISANIRCQCVQAVFSVVFDSMKP